MPIPNLFYGYQDALMRAASPTTLAVGDSWFWYPFDNLLGEIAGSSPLQSIVVAGYNGSEASEWKGKYADSIKTTFDMYARCCRWLCGAGAHQRVPFLQHQDADKHSAADVGAAFSVHWFSGAPTAVDVGRVLAQFYDRQAEWPEVRPYVECVFRSAFNATKASYGD